MSAIRKGVSQTAEKRYVWLKLKEDFFTSKRIKKLRKMAGGDTYTIIYLKMQLLSLKTDGVLRYTGLEDNFAKELALDLDERAEDVGVVLMYLAKCGLIETSDNVNFLLPYVVENTGTETDAARRMREMRSRNNVTPLLHDCDTEKEREKEVEKEIERETEDKSSKEDLYAEKPKSKRFTQPTREEVQQYITEQGYHVDADRFVDYYTSNGWMVGKNHMKDWKAAVRTWERKAKQTKNETNNIFQQIAEERKAHGY